LHVQKALMEYLLCGRLDWFFWSDLSLLVMSYFFWLNRNHVWY
jgi:hypothetical protein